MLSIKSFTFRVLLGIFITGSLFAQSFEGKVNFRVEGDGETADMSYLIKDQKFRMEIPEQQDAAIIMDMNEKKMMMVMNEQKMYMEFPMESLQQMADNGSEEEEMADVQMTGETKTINGYECEKWTYEGEEGSVEAWMTKELGGFMFMGNPMAADEKPEWQSKIEKEGYFPMLVIYLEDGETSSRFEVTSVEKKSLSDDLFTVPAGFQKMDMPMMR